MLFVLAAAVALALVVGTLARRPVTDVFASPGSGQAPTTLLEPVSGGEARPLPDRTLGGFAGGPAVDLGTYRGTPLLVNFWASWCGPCIEEMPALQQVSTEVSGQVAFLGVDVQDNADNAQAFLEQVGVDYDQASDPAADFFTETGGFGMPTTLLVDAEGVIRYRHTGGVTAEQLRALLNSHLGVRV